MVDIFLSHATADTKLAEKFLRFLVEAIGVREKEIFCSSVEGHGIPLGDDFNDYMKNSIQSPKLVILLMTPRYMESWFCLMELGAAWSQSHYTLPIVVPPIEFGAVSSTLGLKQGWSIENEDKLNALREMVNSAGIELHDVSPTTWDKKRTQWKSDLKKLIEKLAKPTVISSEEHAALKVLLEETQKERLQFEDLYQEAQEQIETIRSLKDASEVSAALMTRSSDDLEDKFLAFIDAISIARPKVSVPFYRNVIMDLYGKASRIKSYTADEEEALADAIKYNVIDPNQPHDYLWTSDRMRKVKAAVKALENFLDEEGYEYRTEREAQGQIMDYTDFEFWENNIK